MSILTPPVPEVDDTHDEDMSLESESESEEDDHVDGDEEEAAQEEAAQVETVQEPMPIIQLSFDNARGGAWDDRELVHAYDSAMEEFHASCISQL